jgi:hypothetical protein
MSLSGDHDEFLALRELRRVKQACCEREQPRPLGPGEVYLTPDSILRSTGIKRHTLTKAIQTGLLKATKHSRSWLIHPADFETYRQKA